MIFDNFDQLPWHDAELLSITIDRSDPGNDDSVTLLVRWPNSQKNQIIFRECYALDMDMNFGVIATESIREGLCHMRPRKPHTISVYLVMTTYNSCLKIYAKKYEHIPLL